MAKFIELTKVYTDADNNICKYKMVVNTDKIIRFCANDRNWEIEHDQNTSVELDDAEFNVCETYDELKSILLGKE